MTTSTPPENCCCLIVKYLIGFCFTIFIAALVHAHVYSAINFDIEGMINSLSGKNEDEIFFVFFIIYSLAMFFYIRNARKCTSVAEYNTIYGLKIIFVNNLSLFFVSDSGFIKQTIDQLYSFIARPERASKNELIINFSDSSINIKEAVGSNIIGGSVQGDVING